MWLETINIILALVAGSSLSSIGFYYIRKDEEKKATEELSNKKDGDSKSCARLLAPCKL